MCRALTRPQLLRERLRQLAQERRRFGSPRLHLLLRREGLVVNHKRTERLYREEGLALRRKRRRKGASVVRVEPPEAQRPNEKWAMDFVHDSTADGRRFRALVVMDEYTRECLVIEVDRSLGGKRVVSVLDRLCELRPVPETITMDNGPEFVHDSTADGRLFQALVSNTSTLGSARRSSWTGRSAASGL